MSTEIDKKSLRELCDKATQGDWWIDSHGRQLVAHNPFNSIFITHGEAMGPATRHPETGYLSHWPNDWDASYIVAVQPKVVRGLLDEIDRLQAALEDERQLRAKVGRIAQYLNEFANKRTTFSRIQEINDAIQEVPDGH